MRRRIAHGLAIAFLIVGLGAAQGPNISEAKPAPVSSVQRKSRIRNQLAKMKPVTTKTVVTKLEAKNLPADTFAVPKGYTQRTLGMPPAGQAKAPAPAPSPAK